MFFRRDRHTVHKEVSRAVARVETMFKARLLRGDMWHVYAVCVMCVCVSEVSLATCPVLRAGHLRKVSFSAMGNCYPYYTLKRCAVGVGVCGLWSAIRREQTLLHTLTHTHTHQGHCGRRVREAKQIIQHGISFHFAFISHKYHLHILNTKQHQQQQQQR